MTKREFYYEEDTTEGTWIVLEIDGGKDDGQTYDTAMFWCVTEQDAIDAIELLIELQQ